MSDQLWSRIRRPAAARVALLALVAAATLLAAQVVRPVTARIQAAQLSYWIADDGTKVIRDATSRAQSAVWQASDGVVRLRAARNEVVAFQVVLPGGVSGLSGVDATGGAFRAADASAAPGGPTPSASLMRAWFLHVTEPSTAMYGELSSTGQGWYPDPLVPLDAPDGGAPFDVAPGQNGVVWVDVAVSDGVAPGAWEGTVTVSAAGNAPTAVPVHLTVDPIDLSHQQHMPTYFYYGPEVVAEAHGVSKYTDPYFPIERGYRRMAHDHHFNLSTSVYPDISGEGSSAVVDFASWHDDFAAPYLDGTAYADGVGDSTYALPIARDFPYPDDYDGIDGPVFKATFRTVLDQFADHFRAKGWYDRAFLYIIDEPNDADAYDEVRAYGRLVDESGSGLPLLVTEQPTPDDPDWGSLLGYVDIWDAGTGAFDPAQMAARRAAGDRTWTYNGGEPAAGSQIIDTDGIGMRTWPWIAWRYGVQGWHYWDACYFTDRYNDRPDNDVWADPLTFDQRGRGLPEGWADWGNGDGTLFYPGAPRGIDGPVSSVRMKALRRGMQDYEYLWLARENGMGALADQAAEAMIPEALGAAAGRSTTAWSKDPADWEAARTALAEALAGGRSAVALTLGTSVPVVRYGTPVDFSVRTVPATDAAVSLATAPGPASGPSPGAVWSQAAATRTGAAGSTVLRLTPRATRWWRADASGTASLLPARSSPVLVQVRANVATRLERATVPSGSSVRMTVTVFPSHPRGGVRVEGQRLVGGTWRRAFRVWARLDSRGRVVWSWRPPARGRYRLRATFGDSDHLTGVSVWRGVAVR